VSIKGAGGFSETEVLQLASSLEAGSEHPLAAAVLAAAKEKSVQPQKITQFKAIAGHGVEATQGGRRIVFGNRALMEQKHIDIGSYQDTLAKLSAEGQTPMLLAVDQKVAGIIAVADPIKTDSAAAVQRLRHLGIRVLMLTGDNPITARAIAKEAGIDEVRAQVLPQDKAAVIKELQAQGETVGMVGDGINDAPALAQADVGLAIGTGTDVAIESADVVILQGSLLKVPEVIRLSQLTVINIKQNLFGAFFYNTISIPVAAGLLYPFAGILLNPMIAGAAMAMSSLTVVSNANRLRWQKL
jgi:Cu+-exporting ATPase